MAFDIMNLQRGREPARARSKADEGRAVLKYIDVEDLVPSEGNFYSMSAIEDLAYIIELSGGVKQPALVAPLGGGKYKVISGHRRRLASLQLVKQGKEAYRKMPCMVEAAGQDVEQDAEADELKAIDEAILLITTNSQREKTDWDKVQEATRLRALLYQKRRLGNISGETRKIISEQLETTPAQVGRYDSIEKHLIPAFKNWLEEGKIGISVAYELSTLPEDAQKKAAAECWGKRGPVTLEDVRKWKLQADREEAEKDAPPSSPARMKSPENPEGAHEAVNHHPAEVAQKQPEQAEREQMKAPEEPPAESAGNKVDFPAPLVSRPAPKPEKQPSDKRPIIAVLEDLKQYCQAMESKQGEQKQAWAESVEALSVAIVLLRRGRRRDE